MPFITSSRTTRRTTIAPLLAGCALVLVLGGCQTTTTATSDEPRQTGTIQTSGSVVASDLTHDQALSAVQKWGQAYSADEKSKVAALNYSAALRGAGQTDQAVEVMRKSTILHTNDREVLAAYGKALAADGQFDEALRTVRRAQTPDNPDWRLLAAEGGILDSLGRNEEGRTKYRQALVLAPGEPQVLNNLGMSYTLTGDLDKAEETLRQALKHPSATARIRQNLALVLGLRGNFKEAEAMATRDLSAEQAKENMAYLQKVLNQQDTWSDIKKAG
jgi:Flp pilus assembly protein TadD